VKSSFWRGFFPFFRDERPTVTFVDDFSAALEARQSKAAFSVPGLTHSFSLIIDTRQRMLERLLLSSSIERTTPVKIERFLHHLCREL
jgi:hypothetical protein